MTQRKSYQAVAAQHSDPEQNELRMDFLSDDAQQVRADKNVAPSSYEILRHRIELGTQVFARFFAPLHFSIPTLVSF